MEVGDRVEGAYRVSTGEWLAIAGEVVRATAKAVLVLDDKGEEHWCPLSTCKRLRLRVRG